MGGPSIVPVHTEVFTARPLPESTISGLCPTNHGPLRGSRWKPGRKTEKAGGKRAVAVSWRKKRVQNLLLKYIFGWRALNVPYTFTFFSNLSLIELQFQTCGRLWAKKGKTARDSDALVGDRTLWKTLMIEWCWGQSLKKTIDRHILSLQM